MKKIGIATDSHSSISQKAAKELGIYVLPMPFSIDGQLHYEGIDLKRKDFFQYQLSGAEISTSQPSPGELMDFWDKALTECEQLVYIPISSALSGSCSTAKLLATDEPYEGRVFVVDNGRVSTPLHCTVLDALEMVNKGIEAREIQKILEEFRSLTSIYVAIDNIEYLKKGGRISGSSALLANMLNIKPVVRFDVGPIEAYKKCRGMVKAKKEMFAAIQKDLETKFKDWYDKGDYYLMTATAVSSKENQEFIEEVKSHFPGVEIMSDFLSMGTCCHIGYGGLGIGVSCKPRY